MGLVILILQRLRFTLEALCFPQFALLVEEAGKLVQQAGEVSRRWPNGSLHCHGLAEVPVPP